MKLRTNEERAASIRKAADNIERENASLDLGYFVGRDEYDEPGAPSCNTPACIGGHIAYEAGPDHFERLLYAVASDEAEDEVYGIAREIVDLSEIRDPEGHDWASLFGVHAKYWPEPFRPAEGAHPATTAPAMLRRLAELVEAGCAPGREVVG